MIQRIISKYWPRKATNDKPAWLLIFVDNVWYVDKNRQRWENLSNWRQGKLRPVDEIAPYNCHFLVSQSTIYYVFDLSTTTTSLQ